MRNRLLIALPAIWCVGCGLAKYEERLQETADYFAYHKLLNDNLTKQPWSGSILAQKLNADQGSGEALYAPVQLGVTMRIPLGFNMIPGPQAIPDESTTDNPDDILGYTPEVRQPDFISPDFLLPGIIECWEMPSQSGEGRVRLYVLGNHERYLDAEGDEQAPDPMAFYEHLEFYVGQGLRLQSGLVSDPPGSPTDNNILYRQRFPNAPGRERFQLVKDFNVFNIVPQDQIEGVVWRAQLYEVFSGDDAPIQVAVLCIFPESDYGNVVETLELALETLTVSNQPPSRPDDSGSSGGGIF